MTFKTPLILSTLGILALTACVPADPYGAQPTTGQLGPRAQSGALIGAMAGGLIGSQSSDDRLLKTAVGAGIGAIVGGAIGTTLDQQAQELRGINGQFNVTNMGDYLVVNMPQDVLFGVDSASLRPDLTRDIKSVAQSAIPTIPDRPATIRTCRSAAPYQSPMSCAKAACRTPASRPSAGARISPSPPTSRPKAAPRTAAWKSSSARRCDPAHHQQKGRAKRPAFSLWTPAFWS
jgi:hypothetical protein